MVSKIHIVTDSGSDLPVEVRERLGISVVPLTVQFADEIFRDGEEISTTQFYERLQNGDVMPSTCQPSPADFVRVYENVAEPGDTIISIHLSSKMSGTYQSAVLAGTMLDSSIKVHTIDTKCASLGAGMVAIAGAEAVQAGEELDDILSRIQNTIEQLAVYFVVDTLEYLKKNGRIGLASALFGTLLNIKPVLTLDDGVVAPFEKIRGKSKALKRIQELMDEMKEAYPEQKLRIGISHSNSVDEATSLAKRLQEQVEVDGEILISFIGPTIGVHTGPGTIALFVYPV
jgi:DegV family protein with EDD domain